MEIVGRASKKPDRHPDMLKVAIYVPGMFHYKHYVNTLTSFGLCVDIVFSHKFLERPFSASINSTNLFFKEYLMQGHQRLLKSFMLDKFLHLYHYGWASMAAAKRIDADVVVGMLHGSCEGVFKKAKRSGLPVVGDAVNLHPNDYYSRLESEHRALGVKYKYPRRSYHARLNEIEYIDYLLSPSQAVTRSYVKHGFPSNKIVTIPYGAETKVPSGAQNPKKHDVIRILSVARVIPRKGHHLALAALKRHATGTIELTIVGDADEEYLEKLREIGFPFTHFRHVRHGEVIQMMKEFDLLLLSSIEDGFGMVVTEALSAGLPVAVSKYAGASEMINLSGGGVIFDPYSPSEIWDAIQLCKKRDFPALSLPLRTWDEYASDLAIWLRSLTRAETTVPSARQAGPQGQAV